MIPEKQTQNHGPDSGVSSVVRGNVAGGGIMVGEGAAGARNPWAPVKVSRRCEVVAHGARVTPTGWDRGAVELPSPARGARA